MHIDILTLFPEAFRGPFDAGILKRAIAQEKVSINLHNIRDYSHDRHRTVDDYAYGGGAGMILKPDPLFEAVAAVMPAEAESHGDKPPVILLTPQGRLLTQQVAQRLSAYRHLILICGRYEGIDERVREHLVSDEISIGDYVLSGGEMAAMVVVDAVVRLLPGVLGSEASLLDESHVAGLLEYPQYTRPAVYRQWAVPEVLLSGNHAQIARWRREQSLQRTRSRRPDLISKHALNHEEKQLVNGRKKQ